MDSELIDQLSKNAKVLPARAKGNCRIWFVFQGKPVFISAGTKRAREAREAVPGKLRDWLSQLPAVKSPSTPATAHLWKVEVERFIRLEHKHSKPAYREGVAGVLRDFGAATNWPDVTAMDKAAFRTAWEALEVGKAAHTQANWLGILGGFARFLEEEEIIPRDFTRGVKRPPRSAFGRRETIYAESAFDPIWEELPLWARPLWEDHWFTGMDTKDLWEFQPRKHMVNVDEKWKIWKQRAKQTEIIDQPLNSRIRDRWIKQWEAAGPEDFMYPELHKRFSDEKSLGNQLRKSVYAAQDRRKLPRLDIKSTRHTFTTRHVLRLVKGEKKAPSMDQIRRWLGHAPDSRVLERLYLKLLSIPDLMD